MSSTIIHIGMPRTATTFFQQSVFPKLTDYDYFGIETTHFNDVFNQLQFADDSFYDKELVKAFTKDWSTKNVILSNEGFIGQSYPFNYINRSIIANRLSEIFPDAKILLVLRNQIDLIASLYSISLLWRETKAIDDYIWTPHKYNNAVSGPENLLFNTYDDYENINGYDYLTLINLYKQKFPHVEVLLFEDFIHQPELFSKQLEGFFNVNEGTIFNLIQNSKPVNEGANIKQAQKLIRLNKLETSTSSSLVKKIIQKRKNRVMNTNQGGKKPYFSEQKTKELKSYFGSLNKKLAQEYPEIGIQKYNEEYYL